MKIQVTQEDIDAGEPEDACLCAIALAIQEFLGKPWGDSSVSVLSGDEIRIDGVRYVAADVEKTDEFLGAFDGNDWDENPPMPFELERTEYTPEDPDEDPFYA